MRNTIVILAGFAQCQGDLLRAEREALQSAALFPGSLAVLAHPYRRFSAGRPAALDPGGAAFHRYAHDDAIQNAPSIEWSACPLNNL